MLTQAQTADISDTAAESSDFVLIVDLLLHFNAVSGLGSADLWRYAAATAGFSICGSVFT